MGNTSYSLAKKVTVDTTAPDAPESVSVNGGATIDAQTEKSVGVSGKTASSENGSSVLASFTGTDAAGQPKTVEGSSTVLADGTFQLASVDFSGFRDGFLGYSVKIVDAAGNEGPAKTGTITKSSIPSNGSASYKIGTYTDSTGATLTVSSTEPVSFTVTGLGIAKSVTGILSEAGSVDVSVELTETDGSKETKVTFADAAGTESEAFASVILDRNAPQVSITSFSDGDKAEGATMTVMGTATDGVELDTVAVNGVPAKLTGDSWTADVSLSEGSTTVTAEATDKSGKKASVSKSVIRVPKVLSVKVSTNSSGSVVATFDTDVSGTGNVIYGTDAVNLSGSAPGAAFSTSHNIVVEGLLPDTQYFFQAHASVL